MIRARIAARSAEQIESPDALLAGKVQRKVSNGILLDWPPMDHLGIGRKRNNSCQRKHPAEILALGSSYAPTVAAQTRIVSAAGIGWITGNLCDLQRDILQQHF
jgi:hypothetical protein